MKYLNSCFVNSLINTEVFKEYSKSKHFSEASELLLNPYVKDILNLYNKQVAMSNHLKNKNPKYLIVKFILDLKKGDVYLWNSLFSDENNAYIDIYGKEPEISDDNIIIDPFIISGTAFMTIEKDSLRIDDLINNSKFRKRVNDFSLEELEEFIYNFPLFEEYFKNVNSLAEELTNELVLSKKIDSYIQNKYNSHILKDFIKTYAKDSFSNLAYLF